MKRDGRGIARAIVSMSMAFGLVASFAMPHTALAGTMSKAEKLRRLDIMLMVTGLRCRAGADDFQGDFVLFEARHMPELNRAAIDLEAEGVAAGLKHDEHMVDRLSTAMANNYGNGHPWLGCHELKGLTRQLASADGEEVLIAAAEETLSGDSRATTVMVAVNTPAPTPAPAQPAPTPPAPVAAPAAPAGPVALAVADPAPSVPAASATAPAVPTAVAAKADAPKAAVNAFNSDVTTI